MNQLKSSNGFFGPITYEDHLRENLQRLDSDVLKFLLKSVASQQPNLEENNKEDVVENLISHLSKENKTSKPQLSRSISETRKPNVRHLPTLEESFQVVNENCPKVHFLFARAHNQHATDEVILRDYVDFWRHYSNRPFKLLVRLEQQIVDFVDRADVELFQIGKTSMRKRDFVKGLHKGLSNRYQHGFIDRYSHMICLLLTDSEFVDHPEQEALQVEKELHSMFENHKKFGGKHEYHQSGKVKGPETEYIFFVYLALLKL